MVQEAEAKLKKALNKVEEESSSFTRESQNVRQKLYNWEQNKKKKEEKLKKKKQEEEAFMQQMMMTDINNPNNTREDHPKENILN